MSRVTIALAATGLFIGPSPAASQARSGPEVEVAAAAADFVDAFNNLDWDRFTAAWTDGATVFFPLPEVPARVTGRDSIVAVFRSAFADFPDRVDGPPYLSIDPVDLAVRMVGDIGVVTFHLGDEAPRSRRTLMFVQEEGQWRIAHLHASDPPK